MKRRGKHKKACHTCSGQGVLKTGGWFYQTCPTCKGRKVV